MYINLNKLQSISHDSDPVRVFVHWFTHNNESSKVPMQTIMNKMEYTDCYIVLKAFEDVDLTRKFMAKSLLLFANEEDEHVVKALGEAIKHAESNSTIKSQMNLNKQRMIIQEMAKKAISTKASSINGWYYLRAVKAVLQTDQEFDHGHSSIILLSKISGREHLKKQQKQMFIDTFVKQLLP